MPFITKMTKIKLLLYLFVTFFIFIIVKLFYLQILNPYNTSTDYLKTRKILAERGEIFDTNKEPLVTNQTTYLLYGEPKKIKEKERLIREISEILKVDQATVEGRIIDRKDWVAIKSGISSEDKERIISLRIKGIGFNEESRRYYPESSLSAQLLGFVGKNKEGDSVGYFGIEGFYDKDLSGLPGLVKSEQDLIGRPIFFGTQERVEPENGRDLILTVDKSVQQIVKNQLTKVLEKYQAKQGCVIAADPNNLSILALSCLPDFDPDKYYQFSEDYFKDPAISDLYEPGSIFKPLIMAAAIEEKAVKPDDSYQEDGPIQVGDYTIRTWNNQYIGKISMTKILEKSSNVGIVYIGKKLGSNKLYQYL